MSSTNKTANLQLNQWVLSDPFNMADFNADNAKIDAAVGALPRKKLFDVTLQADAATVQLDLSEIDLSVYAQLDLFFMLSNDGSKYMRFNEVSTSHYSYSTPSGGTSSSSMMIDDGASAIQFGKRGYIYRTGKGFYCYTVQAENIPKINTIDFLTTDASFPYLAGDRITVWGVRR